MILQRNSFFRQWMPYHFVLMTPHVEKARAHTFLPVNRKYKPLGTPLHDNRWVTYENCAAQFVRFTVDPCKLKDIFIGDGLYLYNDDPRSADDYGERFGRLMRHLDTDWLDTRGDRRTRFEMQRECVFGA